MISRARRKRTTVPRRNTIASLRELRSQRPALVSRILWLLAVLFTLVTFTWQDKTGPTYPLEGEIATTAGPVHFKFVRSEIIGNDLPVVLLDPVPQGVKGRVEYRRYKSHDGWTVLPMRQGSFHFERRGRTIPMSGVGATLPGLQQRAGKYEYLVQIDDGSGKVVSVTGDHPVYARYKGDVPTWALIAHIFVIFVSMMFATRTVLEAIVDGTYKKLLAATIASLLAGAFVLGPLIQWYAFGVWWAGVPFGYDWTDNKVLLALLAWGIAAYMNRGERRSRMAVYAAGVMTLLVYFIPHSVFGSEYDFRTGKGQGTAG